MIGANHKLINVSNGNQIYVSDLAAMAQNAVDLMSILPLRSFEEPVFLGDFVFDVEAMELYSPKGEGAVFLNNKVFGLNSGGTDVSFGRGVYIYGIAEPSTAQPRTSTTGVAYSQYVDYYIAAQQSPLPDVTSDITAQTGVFLLVDGAETAAMTTSQLIAYFKHITTAWKTADDSQYDYIVRDNTSLAALNNNPNATNVLILAGNYTMTSPILLNAATKRITAQAGADIYANMTAATAPMGAFYYNAKPSTDDYCISGMFVRSSVRVFTNCRNVENCVVTPTTTISGGLFGSCSNVTNCTVVLNGYTVSGCFSSCNNLSKCRINGAITNDINVDFYGYGGCDTLWACTVNVNKPTGDGRIFGFNDCTRLTACSANINASASAYGFTSCQYITNSVVQMDNINTRPFLSCYVLFGNQSNRTTEGYTDCYMDFNATIAVGPTAAGGYNF